MTTVDLIDRNGCPLCESEAFATHLAFADIPVVRCTECGFLYSLKVLPEPELASSYVEADPSPRHRQGQVVNARCNVRAIRKLLGGKWPESVLDVGAGYGFLLAELARRGVAETVGVELSRHDARFGREQLGVNVIDRPLSEASLESTRFDLVTAFEVIEHTSRPIAFLRELEAYVRPGGYLLIATDNFDGRAARALGAALPKWIPYSHISHFTPATLARAVRQVPGLEVVDTISFTPWELWMRMAWNRIRGHSVEASGVSGLGSASGGDRRETFRLFTVRKYLNPWWLSLTARRSGKGDLM
ncbi:MAG: class I SAM-dependent methyltransferase, partial [Xanthomonadales bacterium]|nr:class I SAM-dependent methyltransferase [Xanthomonadales bacterium]